MKKIRTLPFGYAIEKGRIVICKHEAELVRLSFEKYLAGASLSAIADLLTRTGIPYSETKLIWDKSNVKRLLDNINYIGEGVFPAIISCADYEAAQSLKNGKSNMKCSEPMSADVIALRKSVYCGCCGERLKRLTDKRYTERWCCVNLECRPDKRITDEWLKAEITRLFNHTIENPHILMTSSAVEHRQSPIIIKKKNEFRRELNKVDFDTSHAKALLFDIAAEQYRGYRDNDSELTERLLDIFSSITPLADFDLCVFTQTVDRLLITAEGQLELKLINGQKISAPSVEIKDQ